MINLLELEQKWQQQQSIPEQKARQILLGEQESAVKWYKGSQPTNSEIAARIYTIGQTDKAKAGQLWNAFQIFQQDPSTPCYNPYTRSTNKAVQELQALGFDMGKGVTQNWLNENSWLKNYYRIENGNTPLAPSKTSTPEQNAAYWYYKLLTAEDTTREAETEWKALQEEIRYWTGRKDRNYSDDEILAKIDWSNYKTLTGMDEDRLNGLPTTLNRAVGYSQDALRGVIWAARNGSTGDPFMDSVQSALGIGAGWEDDPKTRAKLDPSNPAYSPYSVGSTIDDAALYFGLPEFDAGWTDRNQAMANSSDLTQRKYYQQVYEAEQTTRKAEEELRKLWSDIDNIMKRSSDPDYILGTYLDENERQTLTKLDQSRKNGKGLVGTTRAIDYRWEDVEAEVRRRCDIKKNAEKGSRFAGELSASLAAPGNGPAPDSSIQKAKEDAIQAAVPTIEAVGTAEDKIVFETAYSANPKEFSTQIAKAINTGDIPQTLALAMINEHVNKYAAENYFDAAADMLPYQKLDAELKALREQREPIVSALDNYAEVMSVPQTQWTMLDVGGRLYHVSAEFNRATGEYLITGVQDEATGKSIASGQAKPSPRGTGVYSDDGEEEISLSPAGAVKPSGKAGTPSADGEEDVSMAALEGLDSGAVMDAVNQWRKSLPSVSKEKIDSYDRLNNAEAFTEAFQQAEELANLITDREAQLEAAKPAYDKGAETMKQIEDQYSDMYALAGLNSEEAETRSLLPVLKYAFAVGSDPQPTVWESYSVYDVAEQYGLPEEEIQTYAIQARKAAQENIDDIDYVISTLEQFGGGGTRNDILNGLKRERDRLSREVQKADYYMLRSQKDFKAVANVEAGAIRDSWNSPETSELDRQAVDPMTAADRDVLTYMPALTQEERDTYLYIRAATQGADAAQAYYVFLTNDSYGIIHKRTSERMEQFAKEFGEESPWLAMGVSGLLSLGEVAGSLYTLKTMFTGEELNPYSSYFGAATFKETSRASAKEEVENRLGVEEGTIGALVFDIGYEAIMNRYDSFVNSLLAPGAGLFKDFKIAENFVGAMPMGLSAAASAARQAKIKGATDEQAYLIFGVNFVAETATEAITYGNIKDAFARGGEKQVISSLKQLAKNALGDMFEEAGGEMAAEAIEQVADKEILQKLSEYEANVDAYIASGIPREKAEEMARYDIVGSIVYAGVVAMVSSGASSMVADTLNGNYADAVRLQRKANRQGVSPDSLADQINNLNKTLVALNKARSTADTASKTETIAGVLGQNSDSPDAADTALAAASHMVSKFGGDKTINALARSLVIAANNGMNSDSVSIAMTIGALADGEASSALTDIMENGATPGRLDALARAAANDQQNEAVMAQAQATLQENKTALEEAQIIADGGADAILPYQDRLAQAKANQQKAQNDLDAAQQALADAEATRSSLYNQLMEDPMNDKLMGELNTAIERMTGAQAVVQEYQQALAKAQNAVQTAQAELERVRNSTKKDIAAEAEQRVAQADQQRQEQRAAVQQAEQEQAAAKEAAEAKANAEEAEEETRAAKSVEQQVDDEIAKLGYTGEQAARLKTRIMNRVNALDGSREDLTGKIGDEDGRRFLRRISRKTGLTFEMQDLGDPIQNRGYITDRQHIVLNSNLSRGQALVEAALHEITHGLETTNAYADYSKFVLDTLHGGRGTEAYNKAIQDKIDDYAKRGIKLTPTSAMYEIVADYSRTNLATKDFVNGLVARGLGEKFMNALRNAVNMLKSRKLEGQERTQYENMLKAQKLLKKAIDERARNIKTAYKGHTGLTQFSISGWTEATGLTLEVTGDENYMYKLYHQGKEIKPGEFAPDMVEGTPVGNLIAMAQKLNPGKDSERTAKQQREFVAKIINMIGKYQDAAMVWELAGSLTFSSLKTNGDPQYGDSIDFGTICTKTQAILNVISETQVQLGRGLTKAEIDGIVYKEVGRGVQDKDGNWKHGATPCPPCYVYATWVNKPARLEVARQCRNKFGDWTSEQITEFMNKPLEGKKNSEITRISREKLWIKCCLADSRTDPDTGETIWIRRENPDLCPDDILLDLRRSGEMAEKHKGTWTFMQKGGNAVGKAVAPYSDARLGEAIVGKARGADTIGKELMEDAQGKEASADYIPKFLNPFLAGDNGKAVEMLGKAIQNARIQNLKGGQRWQSWSDFRAEWGSDYLMEMLTMQALGATVQTYTKVIEGVDLLASAGFEVNLSGMPSGDGFEHNEDGSIKLGKDGDPVLKFSPVTGINPEAALDMVRRYGSSDQRKGKGNVQFMTVGISDEHILVCLKNDNVSFVIPFHGSGGSVKRLQKLMALLSQSMHTGSDYTKAQTDKFLSGETNTNPYWALRVAILTNGFDALTESQQNEIRDNPYLNKLYEDRYLNENSPAYHVWFSQADAQQIYPYEYWDENTTLATADENSVRFVEYCQLLGVIPRFSGLKTKAGEEYANFSGAVRDENGNITEYHPVPGYWKLLIDRSMYNRYYDNDGNLVKEKSDYHEPKAVNVADINVEAMPMAANNTVGHSDDDTRQIVERIVEQIAPARAGNAAPEEANAAIVNKAMYGEGDVQHAAGGQLTDADIDAIIARKEASNINNQYPSSLIEVQPDHTEQQRNQIQNYLGAVDQRVLDAAKLYKKDPHALTKRIPLKPVTEREANIIKQLTGADVSGYSHVVGRNFLEHVEDEHGENGAHDQTMADLNDVARVGWVIENFDEITWDGRTSWGYRDKNNQKMPKILYKKQLDGTVYVVEAVDENSSKILRPITAYIETKNSANESQSNAVTQVSNANGPDVNAQSVLASPAGNIIQGQEESVKASSGGDLTDADIDEMISRIFPDAPPRGNSPAQPVQRQRQFGAQTAQRSEALHQEVRDFLRAHSAYDPETNRGQIDRAVSWVVGHATAADQDGYYGAMAEAQGMGLDAMTADGQARMLTLMAMASMRNDVSSEVALAQQYNEQGTAIGRALQSRRIFAMMSPLGRVSTLQKLADQINQENGKKTGRRPIRLSPELLDAAGRASTPEEFDAVRRQACQEIAAQMPANWKEKLRSWRMLSMLGNPRTHVRNILGNAVFIPAVKLKNVIAAGLEAATQGAHPGEMRTKSLYASKENRQFAQEDAAAIRDTLTGEGKFNPESEIERLRASFGTGRGILSRTLGKGLQAVSDANSWALEAEDWIFLRHHYVTALSQWMQANKITPDMMRNDQNLLDRGREYAINEAQKATYRDASEFASLLSRIGAQDTWYGWVINAVLPFKKTPANILKRGIEYSPVGLIRAISTDLYHLHQYNQYARGELEVLPDKAISPAQWIDRFAAGLSGTAIAALGAFLSHMGVVTVGLDDKEDELDKAEGRQEYAINFSIGGEDYSYTIDWAAPVCMPFFVGASIYEALTDEGKEMDIGGIVDSILEITEPVFNLSMLDGVNSLLNVSTWGEGNAITQIGEKVATNYATSYVPTLLGQVSRTIDPTRRKAYVESGASLSTFRYAIEQMQNKTPYSVSNIPYRNVWGEEDRSTELLAALENFLSPGYISKVEESPVEAELRRLYQTQITGASNAIPKTAEKTIAAAGKTIRLNAEQYDQLVLARGETAMSVLSGLLDQPLYQSSDDFDRLKMVDDAWTYVNQTAKAKIADGTKIDKWVAEAEESGDPVQAIIGRREAAAKADYIAGHKQSMLDSIGDGNINDAMTSIEALKESGKDSSWIRSAVTTEYKPRYLEAVSAGDDGTVMEIQFTLMELGLGYKKSDFTSWVKNQAKKDEE